MRTPPPTGRNPPLFPPPSKSKLTPGFRLSQEEQGEAATPPEATTREARHPQRFTQAVAEVRAVARVRRGVQPLLLLVVVLIPLLVLIPPRVKSRLESEDGREERERSMEWAEFVEVRAERREAKVPARQARREETRVEGGRVAKKVLLGRGGGWCCGWWGWW